MKKTIVYHSTTQPFTEYDEDGKVIKTGSFRKPEVTEKIIQQGGATVVFLDDGSKGVSRLSPGDSFNSVVGLKLAYLRAKILSLTKEITEVIKSTYRD